MLWCKPCLKSKANQLDALDRIGPVEQFDLALDHSERNLFLGSSSGSGPGPLNQLTTEPSVAPVASGVSVVETTVNSSVPAIASVPNVATNSRSVNLLVSGIQQQHQRKSQQQQQPQIDRTALIMGSSEWREVPLTRLLVMIGKVNSLLEDLMTGGLCIDGCPVCSQPIETLLPIIVSCAGVEQQASFTRELELTNTVVTETNLATSNNLSTSFCLPQPSNNQNAGVFDRGQRDDDLLPSTSTTALTRSDRGTLDLHPATTQQAITPNNRLHHQTPGRADPALRKRNARPQLCERELSKLKHELQVMREQIRCPICLDRSRNLVFMCGHATCQWCGDQVTACPICRRAVESRIILY
ncbi:unnamed protein product [Echinostoma caproni]|uniref:RING-type domain-containing protein n=1 Tax=Echinostoma caproni TaxID=27848 RepID=A0A182ZZA1_9TREM|nr:unnamed protein product [Echinostoma caproni]